MRLSFSSAAARVAFPALLGALTFAGCAPDQTAPTPGTGSLNLSRHVAVGDNYLAGFSDGGLTQTSQQYSLAALLDQQFALTSRSTSTFTQPLMPAGPGTVVLTGSM